MYVELLCVILRKEAKQTLPNKVDLSQRLSNLSNGRDEMNLCELPFALLSERQCNRKFLQFEVEDYDREKRSTVSRKLTVKGDPEFGLPTAKDEEIYLGLLKYTNDYNGFNDAKVTLKRPELFELMGWPKSDWAYTRLTLGMQRLVGVRLSYQNQWRDNRDKQFRDQGAFGILDSFRFVDARKQKDNYTEHASTFRWSNVLFQSFDCGYLKRIDFGLSRDLSATARRLYRYLDKHFHPPHHRKVTMDLARLAYQHIGVSPGIELDKVRKRYIAPAAEELEAVGFLKPLDHDTRFTKVRRSIWTATFDYSGARQATTSSNPCPRQSQVLQALSKRGISTLLAIQTTNDFPIESITCALKAMDEQRQRGVTIRNADKWLTKALQDGFQPSPEFMKATLRPERQIFRRK